MGILTNFVDVYPLNDLTDRMIQSSNRSKLDVESKNIIKPPIHIFLIRRNGKGIRGEIARIPTCY